MSVVDGGSSNGLVQRVQDILLRPKPTWDVIDGEPATVNGLYVGYICILAAIGPVCSFISSAVFGGIGFGLFALVTALVSYVLGLGLVYVMSLVVDGLAPSFGGQKSQIQALKAITYASTAAWVGGVFNLIPVVGPLLTLLAALYSLYLLYLGLPKLMKVPEDKGIVFVIVTVVIYVVIAFVIGLIVAAIAAMGLIGGAAATGNFS